MHFNEDERIAKIARISEVVRTEFPDAAGYVVIRIQDYDPATDTRPMDAEVATGLSPLAFGEILRELVIDMETHPISATSIIDEGGEHVKDPFHERD